MPFFFHNNIFHTHGLLLLPDEGSCYVVSTRHNYCKFYAPDNVYLQCFNILLQQNATRPAVSFKILTLNTLAFIFSHRHQSVLNFCNQSMHQSVWLTTRSVVFEIPTYFRDKNVLSSFLLVHPVSLLLIIAG